MQLFDRTIQRLSAMADFRAQRHKVIVSNVTNIDVPKYKAKELNFHGELGDALGRGVGLVQTDARHLPGSTADGNHDVVDTAEPVKLDREMGNLAENQLMYTMTIETLARKFRGLSTVLKEAK
ncbi:MAG: flagellar basal body rod protein FlgB [Syntrophales bacterium]